MGFTDSKLYKNVKEALKPGVTPWLITVTRFAIILCFCAMFSLFYLDGSIHYLVAAVLSLCLFLSFEYSVIYIKKCPEFLNLPDNDKPNQKKEE